MPDPALCPGHALPLTFPPIDRLPSTTSAAADQTALFGASQVLCSRPTPRLFHGSYASYYPRFMRSLMKEPALADEEWSRTVECSRCMKAVREGTTRLVSEKGG